MATNTAKKKLAPGRHLSAFKRERQTIKRTERNRNQKSALRTAIKKVKANPSSETLKTTIPAVDKAASKGIIPKKRSSRIISRLTLATNKANANS
ncbi:MAG: 30S ribosomal protein S20 [Pseudomonadota bacterium]